MTTNHYRMQDRVPSVIITTNRNELKVYQGNQVYLNDGDNFELRFFNPTNQKLGISVEFNGVNKGNGLLVINPGQDITLDRFLDEQRKMLFETYTVDGNNSDAVKAIQQNGIINFKFFKEKSFGGWDNYPYGSSGARGGLPHFTNCSTSNANSRLYSKSVKTKSASRGISLESMSGDQFDMDEGYLGIAGGAIGSSNLNQNLYSASMDSMSAPLETGRIEMGEQSNQELKHVDMKFEQFPFYTVSYKMLPFSAKATEVQEVRNYCSQCGYRIRKASWKFCPKCSSKID